MTEDKPHMCANCVFYFTYGLDKGECRRAAPVVRNEDLTQRARWPIVTAQDWCGEGRMREDP